MSIREVTFEELLAILQSPPGLVPKVATRPENPDRCDVDKVASTRELVEKKIPLINANRTIGGGLVPFRNMTSLRVRFPTLGAIWFVWRRYSQHLLPQFPVAVRIALT
jgi:hypothetical protein